MRDMKRLKHDPPVGIAAAPSESNILHWHAVIFGPPGTPWEGGTFKLTLSFSEEYPNKPPQVSFVSPMFHPNSTCNQPCAVLSRHSLLLLLWDPVLSSEFAFAFLIVALFASLDCCL